jgi:signal transduction histidine kinase
MSRRRERSNFRGVAGKSSQAWAQADEVRLVVPIFALAVAVVAAVADRSSIADLILIAIPVAAFVLWTFLPSVPLSMVALAVVIPVVVAQRSGSHEPLMFEASVLAFVVGRWSGSLTMAGALGLLAVASPVAVGLIEARGNISVGIWILGVAFPWLIARAVFRQGQLAAQLEATRHELAQQAMLEERRRIARDVHDFVGHGLAAVMLQVTSARHVLRRDPAEAEEALRSAEDVGRRSMQELRRTVALLRSDDEAGVLPPLPSAREIPALVDHAQAGGLAVELVDARGSFRDRVERRFGGLPDRPGGARERGTSRAAGTDGLWGGAVRWACLSYRRDRRLGAPGGNDGGGATPLRLDRDARAGNGARRRVRCWADP